MSPVFADTFYFVALLDTNDRWHQRARDLETTLLVTSDAVLIEFVNFFASSPRGMREAAVEAVEEILSSDDVQVLPQTRGYLLDAMALFVARSDKHYSLTDCISMQMMRELGISEVLTHDRHFTQEGFVALLR